MKMKSLVALTVALSSLSVAMADESSEITSGIELSAGYEIERMGVTVPETNDSEKPTEATDGARGGARVVMTFQGVNLDALANRSGELKLTFLPITFVADPQHMNAPQDFGRVKDYEGNSSAIRRVVGVLVEGRYSPENSIVIVRGKLASVEYDRDRGLWDWRVLNADVGVNKTWKSKDGQHKVTLQASVGTSGGMLQMRGFDSVQEKLGISPVVASTPTLTPFVEGGAKYQYRNRVKVELMTNGEHRFDLRSGAKRGSYLGREVSVGSDHAITSLSADYYLPVNEQPSNFSAFAKIQHEYDTLTLSNVLFDSRDSFNSTMFLFGVRGKF